MLQHTRSAELGNADRYLILGLMSAAMMLEGYDVQVMGYAAPAIIKSWSSSKAAFGTVFGILQFGMLLGGLILSPFGDAIGRKRAAVLSCLAFGLLTFPVMAATSIGELVWLRGLAGIALGVTLPTAVAVLSQTAPTGMKSRCVGIGYVAYSIGNVGGGAIAAWLIPAYGWQSVFLVGGIVPVVLAALLVWWLPSLPVERSAAGQAGGTERKRSAWDVSALFRDGRALMTVSLWIALAGAFMASHFFTNWLPTVLESSGLPLRDSILATSVLMAGGLVGCFAVAYFVDKFGIEAIIVTFVVAVPLVASMGWGIHSEAVLMAVIALAGALTIGGQSTVVSLSGAFYPDHIKSTGVGWTLGMGRLGSIMGPVIGGILLSFDLSPSLLYCFAASPLVVATLSLVLLRTRRARAWSTMGEMGYRPG